MNEIKIDGDGNCLYITVSFYLLKNQDYHIHKRELVFKCIYNNKNDYLEYCFNDKGIDYLKIEYGDRSKIYELDEYISNIKKLRFYGGCIELNALSKIFNLPIAILKSIDKDAYKLKVVYNFNNISKEKNICNSNIKYR